MNFPSLIWSMQRPVSRRRRPCRCFPTEGDTRYGFFTDFFDGFQTFHCTRIRLAICPFGRIWPGRLRFYDGFPCGNADFFRQQVQVLLHGEACSAYAEPGKRLKPYCSYRRRAICRCSGNCGRPHAHTLSRTTFSERCVRNIGYKGRPHA